LVVLLPPAVPVPVPADAVVAPMPFDEFPLALPAAAPVCGMHGLLPPVVFVERDDDVEV
jgi:hypothetical protein